MRLLLCASTALGLFFTCLQTTSAATTGKPSCVFKFGSNGSGVKTFFNKDVLLGPALPCRYKVANFRCGQVDVNIEADYAKHAHPKYFLNHIINSLDVHLTLSGNSSTYTITNDSFQQYVQNGMFNLNPWHIEGLPILHSYFNQTLKAAVIEKGGFLIQHYYRQEMSRDWNAWVMRSGPVLNIRCLDKDFRTYEDFPYTACGNLEYTYNGTLYNEELPLDAHDLSEINSLLLDYTMMRNHSVQQSNPQCAEASSMMRGGPCQGRSPIRLPGDNLRLCLNAYRASTDSKGLDSLKWFVACLRAVCQAGQETPQDTCSALYEMGREVFGAMRDWTYGNYARILEVTTCPPDPALPVTTNPPPVWLGPAKCVIADMPSKLMYYQWDGKFTYLRPFALGGEIFEDFVAFNSACRYIMADIQCSGAKVVVHVGFSRSAGDFVYPSDATVYITNPDDDGQVTSRTFDLSIAAAQTFVTSGDVHLSYNATDKSVTLVRDGLRVTMTYIDPNNESRPESGSIVSVECSANDFSSVDQPDTLCGGPVFQKRALRLIKSSHHVYAHLDVLFLGKQGLQQTSDECSPLQLAVNASIENNCRDRGDILWECQELIKPLRNMYGSCIKRENLDRAKILSSCIHSLCQTAEAGKPETCAILQTVADLCGASPPIKLPLSFKVVSNDTVHTQLSRILTIGGCT